MKGRQLVISILLLFCSGVSYSQFTSVQDGDWHDGATWGNTSPGVVGVDFPGTGDDVIIALGHNIIVPNGFNAEANNIGFGGTATGSDLTVADGGSFSFTGTFTVGSGPATRGKVFINGRLIVEDGATFAGGIATVGRLTIGATGIYQHNYSSSPGQIYTASWNAGSTLEIAGYTSNVGSPIGLNQSFFNVVWNCANQADDFYLDVSLVTINGNLEILEPISGFIVGLTENADYTLNIGGDLIIASDVYLDLTNAYGGTGSAIVNIGGNLQIGSPDGIGSYGSGSAEINFNGISVQEILSSSDISSVINFSVLSGSTLVIGSSSYLSTQGNLILESNSKLILRSTNSSGAIASGSPASSGNLRVTGIISFASGSVIEYGGSASQFIGSGHPSGAGIVCEINNSAGVTLASNVTIGGDLVLTNGNLSVSNRTLTLNGGFTPNSNFLNVQSTSSIAIGGTGSFGTLRTTGSTTLNNFTLNRPTSGSVTLGTDLTITGTLTQTDGDIILNGRILTISGAYSRINGNINGDAAASLIVDGSGSLPAAIAFAGTQALNTLTINRSGATFATNSALTLTNLNLLSGTFNNTGTITMNQGGILTRREGSIINNTPTTNPTTNSYDIVYDIATDIATGAEIPSLSTQLRNLTKTGGAALTLAEAITINGNFTISNGSFNASTFAVDLKGNFDANSTSILTSSPFTFSGTTSISGGAIIRFGDVTLTGSVTPTVNIRIDGNLVNNGTLVAGSGTQTVTFGGTTTISGGSAHNFNNVTISGTLTAPTGNFNVAGTWTNNGTFNRGVSTNTVTFNGTTSIAGSSPTTFSGIFISGTLNAPATLTLAGNFTNNGTFNRGTGTVVFAGSSTQNIQGTAVTDFNNITVNNVAGPPAVRVQSNQNLRGVLTLASNSQFDADGSGNTSVFTLVSSADDPTADASIATIPTGASVVGNVTVQRYMSIEGANSSRIYRYISSPVQSPAVSQIQPEIPVTGSFTGTSTCSGCGSSQSMFHYNESVTTDTNGDTFTDFNDGYEDFPNAANSETLTNGRGYAIFVRANVDPIATAGSARWDVRAPINSGTISYNGFVSFTSSGTLANDGWNLVGNPYPSTIDWDAATGWTRTGINNAIYMRDNGNASPVYATYVNGVDLNGGSRYIATGQAFYVKSDGGPINFQSTENVKAAGTQTSFFRVGQINDLLRIALKKGTISDETAIRFSDEATDGFDAAVDAYKLKNATFNLSTITNSLKLAVNALPVLTCASTIPLDISDAVAGAYTLEFSEFDSFDNATMIKLVDDFLGQSIDVRLQTSYNFEITGDPNSSSNRFKVIFSLPSVDDSIVPEALANYCGSTGYEITLPETQAGVSYYATLGGNTISEVLSGSGASLIIPIDESSLTLGENSILLYARQSACEPIPLSQPVHVNFVSVNAAAIESSGNTLYSNYSGGNQWYFNNVEIAGATGSELVAETSGLYKLVVTTPEGCTTTTERQFVVTALEKTLEESVHVYPNPVGNKLKVEIESAQPVSIKIFNTMGISIASQELTGESRIRQAEFDLSNHVQGIYIVQVQRGTEVRQLKIIKTKK